MDYFIDIDIQKLIKQSQVFCILPWIHLEIQQEGNIYSCCHGRLDSPIGNTHKNPTEDAFNSHGQKLLRLNMLNDIKSSYCNKCYQTESIGGTSERMWSNSRYNSHKLLVKKTNNDGSIDNPKLIFLGIRFSNRCNLKCIYCSPRYSTGWDSTKSPSYSYPEKQHFFDFLDSHIDNIQTLYLAGGEPLLQQQSYQLLEYLIYKNKTQVELLYNTNLTTLTLGKHNILKLWKSFKKISIDASLDDSYERNDYIRKNSKWQKIVKNRELIKKECPHATFTLHTTVSIFNVFHMVDFFKEWINCGFVLPYYITLNLLEDPSTYSIQSLPIELKQKLKQHYTDFTKNFLLKNFSFEESIKLIKQLKVVMRYAQEKALSLNPDISINKTEILDIFPELKQIFQSK